MEGINSRLDGIQAAILNIKLKYIEEWNAKRQQIASTYNDLLKGVGDIQTPPVRNKSTHIYHVYCIRTGERDKLKKYLEERGIKTAIHYPTALPNMKAYEYLGHTHEDFPVATQAEREILSLPIFPEMTTEQIKYVCDCIKSFFE
jgi:dTDP-4-amino-4,6-dideoxygalactose transaminase